MPKAPHDPSHVIHTRKGVRNNTLYYDPNIFTEDMILSVSLLVGDDVPSQTHYNTTFGEGEYSDGILLHAVPKDTDILGMKNPIPPLATTYFISSEYDSDNEYTYSWSVVEGTAILGPSLGKKVTIDFQEIGSSVIECTITNVFGGKRTVQLAVYAGVKPQKILVIRNPKKSS